MVWYSHSRAHRQIGAVVFGVTFAALTTAADYPDRADPTMPGYWERMVLTIGLGATLALMFAGITAWLIKNNMRQNEQREIRLMSEIAKQREAFAVAMEKVHSVCPLHSGSAKEAFDRELGRGRVIRDEASGMEYKRGEE